jgi:hypothetical protein
MRLHQLVSECKVLFMAPITRRKGNHFSTLHDVYDCDESVHEDQGKMKGDNQEVQAAIRAQVKDLTS